MTKARYHHGDLRNALLRAAASLAETGPEAVTIRAAAKLVGVTPTAAYRHFANHEELLQAVKQDAFHTLGQAMTARLAQVPPDRDPVLAALARLDALGRGYIGFAMVEPGLFRTAFFRGGSGPPMPDVLEHLDSPFTMLSVALDDLVAVGYLAEESRPMAELAAWAAVHGVATLMTEGPMAEMPDEDREQFVDRTMAAVGVGFSDGPRADAARTDPAVRTGRLTARAVRT